MSQNAVRALDPGIRRWLEDSFRTSLEQVRVHTGPHADAVADLVGGVAASYGPDIFLSNRVDQRSDHSLHVLAHEVAHTLQRHVTSRLSRRQRRVNELHAEMCAHLAMAGLPVGQQRLPLAPGGARTLQGFNAWEHRLIGDVMPGALVALATHSHDWERVLKQQLAYMMLWVNGIGDVSELQMQQALPDATVVTLPNGLLATLGELNAVGGDFAADPHAINTMPRELMGGILQQIRQESGNRFLQMLNQPTRNFRGAITTYSGDSTIGLLRETLKIDKFTASLGINHYNGLLARNACHFAPFSWHRWRHYHDQARALALAAFRTRNSTEKARLTNEAWVAQAYADHFIEDSFAAGHLINKTLIMQWFTEWAASQILLPVPDWDLVKNMTAAQQPDLMGRELYGILQDLTSNDPQTAEERHSFRERITATHLRPTAVPVEVAYRQYLAFLNAAVVQLSSNFVHNYFNDNSLTVTDTESPVQFKIYGDEKLLSFGDAVVRPGKVVKASQLAVREILQKGETKLEQKYVLSKLPATVEFNGVRQSLGVWHGDEFKDFCRRKIFGTGMSYVKEWTMVLSPRLGLISKDQATSGLGTAWQTSLPGCGYHDVVTLFDGTRAYAASNGYVYRLNMETGTVEATNSLSGRGHHEVRLASNGGDLFVGINGYVLALDARDLHTKWELSLPGSGFALVNLLMTQNGRLYAGSNGHVYRINPDTKEVLHHNSLPGYGKHEIRLAEFADVIAAGTNGWVAGLNAESVETKWETNLKGSGWHVVDLATGGLALLTGSNGHAYALDPGNGTIQAHNDLSGLGYTTVNVTSSDGSTMFIGTHGAVLALNVDDGLKPRWRTSLSKATGRVVDVYWQDGWLFAGVNGYLYQLDPETGSVLYTNGLKDRGFNDMRLASDGVTVYCGINGYVVGVKPDPR